MAINKTAAGTFRVDFRDQSGKRFRKTFATFKRAVAFDKETAAHDTVAHESMDEIAPKSRAHRGVVDGVNPRTVISDRSISSSRQRRLTGRPDLIGVRAPEPDEKWAKFSPDPLLR